MFAILYDTKTHSLAPSPKVLHPFGLLMHTHRHGIEASSWRVRRRHSARRGGSYEDEWTLLLHKEPTRSPQSFYPPNHAELTLIRGDVIAFRCGMINLGDKAVRQGLASFDEMCDLYMLYWTQETEGGPLESGNYCWSQGLPSVTWLSLGLRDIPREASVRW